MYYKSEASRGFNLVRDKLWRQSKSHWWSSNALCPAKIKSPFVLPFYISIFYLAGGKAGRTAILALGVFFIFLKKGNIELIGLTKALAIWKICSLHLINSTGWIVCAPVLGGNYFFPLIFLLFLPPQHNHSNVVPGQRLPAKDWGWRSAGHNLPHWAGTAWLSKNSVIAVLAT